MRIAVVLLACLAAGAVTSAFADPQNEAQAAAPASTAPSAPAPAAAAATSAHDATAAAQAAAAQGAAAKVPLDKETQHFVNEGYKPEMRHGELVYCKKETVLGSRLAPVKYCGTIEELKLAEDRAKQGVSDAQRQQQNPEVH